MFSSEWRGPNLFMKCNLNFRIIDCTTQEEVVLSTSTSFIMSPKINKYKRILNLNHNSYQSPAFKYLLGSRIISIYFEVEKAHDGSDRWLAWMGAGAVTKLNSESNVFYHCYWRTQSIIAKLGRSDMFVIAMLIDSLIQDPCECGHVLLCFTIHSTIFW